MSFFTAERVRSAAHGRWLVEPAGGGDAGGASIDSRTIGPGQIFFALCGERTDGHRHVGQAAHAGAWVAVVERDIDATQLTNGCGVLVVENVADALVQLARAYRDTFVRTRVVAVTGSNGKTTATRMIDAALGSALRGSASVQSFNNALGVPLTLLNARPGDDYLVCELGSNHPGEIERLARIVRPHVAVITSIARAHLEGFGSVAGVVREKGSLLGHVGSGGAAIVTGDVPELLAYASGAGTLVTFGEREGVDFRVTGVRSGTAGVSFTIDGIGSFELAMLGGHNAINAAGALAVARWFGVDMERAGAGLARVEPPAMRLERCTVGGVQVINDAYNANPDSMLAAIRTLGAVEGSGRKVVVLGDMLEIGHGRAEHHREVADALADDGSVSLAVLVGPLMRAAAARLHERWGDGRVVWIESLDGRGAAAAASLIEPGDTVLLKGSRAIGVERVLAALRADAARTDGSVEMADA